MSPEIETYLSGLESDIAPLVIELTHWVDERLPDCSSKLAWGFPCWLGHERIVSVMPNRAHCNLQLWSGNRLASRWPNRIEGTGKQLRHVKIRGSDGINAELEDILAAAYQLDCEDPVKVR